MAIDATVKGPSANSYVTEAEADAYFALRPNTSAWTPLSSANKELYLRAAVRILETRVMWPGNKTTSAQAMQWPRTSVRDRHGWSSIFVYLDPDLVPQFVKDAQCEQALYLVSGNPYDESDKRGIKSVGVGEINVEFDKAEPDLSICRAARELIAEYGIFHGNNPAQVRLERV